MNGGVIDAELRPNPDGTVTPSGAITVNTRYFVQGEKPSESTNPEVMKQYTVFAAERDKYGVETISVDKLLSLMGWKAEEKIVPLAGERSSGGDFRKRTPGKTQPAAGAPAAGSPGAAPAAPAAADPFAAGGASAPATPPAPAAGAADPFATPAAPAAPKPAADSDPFAVPK